MRRQLASLFIVFSLMSVAFPQRPVVKRRAGSTVVAAPPLAPSTGVVISQVYGGAGCGTAGCSTYKNDYIELFNRGASPQSLNGWSVQYSSATSTTWTPTALTNVTLQPGQYYLVAEGAGANGVNNIPTADAIGTIAMSATAAKVALVNTTTALSGTCPSGASIIDLIGYGSTASCFETSPAPAPSTTTADVRAANGCTETDNNSTDFMATAPNPRNTSAALMPCGGPSPTPTLSINDVPQVEGNAGATTFTFTVSLSAPAPADGVTFNVDTADGTAQDGTPAGEDNDYVAVHTTGSIVAGSSSTTVNVNVNGDTTTEANETFTVNITNVVGATLTDGQGLGTIQNDDVSLTKICQIQGSGSTSPVVGANVTTTGVVTGVKVGSSGGFFIQDDACDADANTSDGIFVFSGSSVPAGVVIGNRLQVSGTVVEFIFSSDPNSPPVTELSGTVTVAQLSTGNPLPTPVTLTAAETTQASETTNPLDTLEEYEGMRVIVPSMTVVAPTQGNINESSATVTSTGVFYGVVTGVTRPFREPGINISDPLPSGAPANVPRFDENPEKIRVDSDGQPGTTVLNLPAGTVLTNVTGPLDYGFRTYTILPDAATPPTVGTLPTAQPVPTRTTTELTVASFNMERFFDTVNDPAIGEPVLTTTAFNNRLNKASLIIRTIQLSPDVIGVEEMENLSTLQQVADKINADAGTPGDYQAYLAEGNDVGGIDNGFLVRSSRVTVVDVTQFGKDTTYINPNNNTPELLNDRPPLVLRGLARRPGETTGAGSFAFTVIVNHLRSLSGIDDPVDGNRIRTKRRAQAEYLANLIQSRQTADPTERIISVGDYNAFQINDGFVDVIGTIKGTPTPPDQVVLASSDLVNPDLTDLVDTLPPDQRYSFTFDGSAQVLDHIIVNQPTLAIVNRFVYARDDADFPVKDYEDPTKPQRLSDHDQPIVYLSLGVPQPAGSLLISEFRLRGPNGANDEFVEIYNNTSTDVTVAALDGSAGYSLVASDGVTRFTIPNGTVIPARGHYLGVNSAGYSLATYPAGNGTTATGDATYSNDIPDNAGIALFNTSNPANFTMANRLDAVGSTSETNTLYKEDAGYPALNVGNLGAAEYAFYRDLCGFVAGVGCTVPGTPQDTNINGADFLFVDTVGTSAGAGSRLGAPGPENLSSPIQRNSTLFINLLDATVPNSSAPNRVRDSTSDPSNNSMFGTLSIRRRVQNNSGGNVTRLRFRIVQVTTFPQPSGIADLRARTSTDVPGGVNVSDSQTCSPMAAPCTVTVNGTTLEEPPLQPRGGGYNSSLSVTLAAPLAPGASINVQFLLGIQQTGSFRFYINVEALP